MILSAPLIPPPLSYFCFPISGPTRWFKRCQHLCSTFTCADLRTLKGGLRGCPGSLKYSIFWLKVWHFGRKHANVSYMLLWHLLKDHSKSRQTKHVATIKKLGIQCDVDKRQLNEPRRQNTAAFSCNKLAYSNPVSSILAKTFFF